MAAFGLVITEPEPEQDIEVWPDNWQVMQIFTDMLSQWNVGMSGVIGLRYESLPIIFEMHGIKRKARHELFKGIRVMEMAAVEHINGK